MPSVEIKCEFCDKLFRKNEVARHIKAKHVTELAKFLLDEYIENPSSNCLQRYANCINPASNGLESKLYSEGVYYFGANPAYFEGSGWGSYVKSDENMKEHNQFLSKVVESISLLDFIQAKRDIIVKSDAQRKLINENLKLKEEIESLKEELESTKSQNSYLSSVVNDFKIATECNTTIQDMKDEIISLNSTAKMYKEELEELQQKYNTKCDNILNERDELIIDNLSNIRKVEEQFDDLYGKYQKITKELKDVKENREVYANQKVEKETQKIKHQLEKEKDKEVERIQKDSKKKEKKLKEEIKKLKLKQLSSDSDSDSDSD